MMFKKDRKTKTRKFTTPDGVVVTVTTGKASDTLFPEKLARMNETLLTLKNSPFTLRK